MALPADYEHDVGHSAPSFHHEGPWTLDEVLALPEDLSQRIELVDGTLLVSPLGTGRHQKLVGDCYAALRAACPPDHEVMPGLNVGLSGGRMLIPDVTVNRAGFRGLLLPVQDLLLAVEVLSPSTRLQDLTLKRTLYGEAGVPFYLVVDPRGGEPAATLFELDGVEYRESARSTGGVLKLEQPFPVTIELSP
ncbi:Uma2 family endonuclease [Saccharothrix saharensis]|uniref:Uma2 family endonuclease n=1 Tax=Saccharothrix saharensis TaxID=571190 RepID=A0A543JLC4_9PSEU|nr:Uma2 family endonuclease [Saccharothrix saharensis]TQM83639.1 Uma2 family endonuclease [Saccharothrix saharensis]